MRLTLYIPLLHSPARISILVASSTAILRTYSRLAGTRYFYPKWVETRRILTAAHSLLYSFLQGELHILDFLPITELATDLLERSKKNQPPVQRFLDSWHQMLDIAGKSNYPLSHTCVR